MRMADGAVVVHQVCMTVEIRSFHFAMASDTGGPDGFFPHHFVMEGAMRLMAVGTE